MDFRPGQRLLATLKEGEASRRVRVAYAFPAGLLLVDDDGQVAFVSHSQLERTATLDEDGNSESVPTLK